MKKIDGELVGTSKDVIREYYKTRGIRIFPTRISFWRRKGLFEGCIAGRTKGGFYLYKINRMMIRMDRIFAYKKLNGMKLAEIRLIILQKMDDEDYFLLQRRGY